MRRWFFTFLLLGSQVAVAQDSACKDVALIDREIQELQDKRLKSLSEAERLEDEAVRWQFRGGQFNETRIAYMRAEAARKEAAMYEAEICALEDKKMRLQKKGHCP